MQKEANILCQLRHSNIVSSMGIVWCPGHYGIAMSLAQYGSLKAFCDTCSITYKIKVNQIIDDGTL